MEETYAMLFRNFSRSLSHPSNTIGPIRQRLWTVISLPSTGLFMIRSAKAQMKTSHPLDWQLTDFSSRAIQDVTWKLLCHLLQMGTYQDNWQECWAKVREYRLHLVVFVYIVHHIWAYGWSLSLFSTVCTQLLVSRPDEENITCYLQLLEKCLTHEVLISGQPCF